MTAATRSKRLFRPSRPDFIETRNASSMHAHARSYCSGHLGRTSLRLFQQSKDRRKRPNCSGHLGRTSLRLPLQGDWPKLPTTLFRPSRPDFIETGFRITGDPVYVVNCSGHLGRTSLRPTCPTLRPLPSHRLFRPSRPDFIETSRPVRSHIAPARNCSGHLGRTSLRPALKCVHGKIVERDCSGHLGRTSLRLATIGHDVRLGDGLFRPSRPDFIETSAEVRSWQDC